MAGDLPRRPREEGMGRSILTVVNPILSAPAERERPARTSASRLYVRTTAEIRKKLIQRRPCNKRTSEVLNS